MRQGRVLLADSHLPMLQGVRRLLESRFAAVVMVADEGSLLETIERLDPDLVVVDLSMPVQEGSNVARQLMGRFPGLRLIALSVHDGTGGLLVLTRPWPAMLRTLWRDDERHREVYWERFSRPGRPVYLTGDGAVRDPSDGYLRILGRVDDVLNVSGHRLSTMEVESAIVAHAAVAEAAVVARPDATTGEAVVAFVTLRKGFDPNDATREAIRHHVDHAIGKFARPAEVRFADSLPKTRSGKIMRRLLRDVAAGRVVSGDTSTLEDLTVLAKLREEEES